MPTELETLLLWVDATQPDGTPRATEPLDIADGTRLLEALRLTGISDFADVDLREAGDNWVMRRANLNELLERCATFCVTSLGGTDLESILNTLDATAVARNGDASAATGLLIFVATVCVLGGGPEVIRRVKALPKESQPLLQKLVKGCAKEHGLSRRKPTASGSSAAASPEGGNAEGDRTVASPAPQQSPSHPNGNSPTGKKPTGAHYGEEYQMLLEHKNELDDRLKESESKLKGREEDYQKLDNEYQRINTLYNQLLHEQTRSESLQQREMRLKLEQAQEQMEKMGNDAKQLAAQHAAEVRTLQSKIGDADRLRLEADDKLLRVSAELEELTTKHKLTSDRSDAHARNQTELEAMFESEQRKAEDLKRQLKETLDDNGKTKSEVERLRKALDASQQQLDELQTTVAILEKHSSSRGGAGGASGDVSMVDDVSPQPVAAAADHTVRGPAVEGLMVRNDSDVSSVAGAELIELKERVTELTGRLEEKDKELDQVRRHVALAARSHAGGAGAASGENSAALELRTQELERQLVEAQEEFRDQQFGTSTLLWLAGRRNLQLKLQLIRAVRQRQRPSGSALTALGDLFGLGGSTSNMALPEAAADPNPAPSGSLLARARWELERYPLRDDGPVE